MWRACRLRLEHEEIQVSDPLQRGESYGEVLNRKP